MIAITPLSSTLFGVALTALLFLTLIGFAQRRTNVIEAAGMVLYFAYNVWMCSEDGDEDGYGSEAYYAAWLLNTPAKAVAQYVVPYVHLSQIAHNLITALPSSLTSFPISLNFSPSSATPYLNGSLCPYSTASQSSKSLQTSFRE